MAEEEKKPDAAEGDVPAVEPSSTKKMIIMGVIVFVNLIILGVVSIFVIKSVMPKDENEIRAEKLEEQAKSEKSERTYMGKTSPPIELLFNLADPNQDSFCKMQVQLEYEAERAGEVEPQLLERMPKMKEIALSLFRTQNKSEILNVSNQKKIKERIKNDCNKIFPEPNTIRSIFIVELVIQ